MSDEARAATLELARSLERKGQIDAAVRAYLRVGGHEEAASALAGAGRLEEAAQVIAGDLPERDVTKLGHDERRRLTKAAIFLAKAGKILQAVELFSKLGEVVRAADLLERAGDPVGAARLLQQAKSARRGEGAFARAAPAAPAKEVVVSRGRSLEEAGKLDLAFAAYMDVGELGHAGRVARKLGKTRDAAALFDDAKMPYEAGVCWMEAGEKRLGLERLARMSREDPRYRRGALLVVRLAVETGSLDYQIDHMLGSFVRSGPRDEAERDALFELGRLYEAQGFDESARDVYDAILRAHPTHHGALERREELQALMASKMREQRIAREDDAFHRQPAAVAPDWPALPPVSSIPPAPSAQVLPGHPPAAEPPRTPTPPSVRTPASSPRAFTVDTPLLAPPPVFDPLDLPRGARVADRYDVVRRVGQGGMASVYEVVDTELGETVAMKLFGQSREDGGLVARFKQEVSLSRRLAHANIIRLYDLGTHAGCKFLTMELLRGADLAHVIAQGRPSIPDALRLLVQSCAGLYAAHSQGIIHRDVKPDNFFVTDEGVVKLMDFGIAKGKSAAGQSGLTVAGFIAGTPAYMSPEQISNFGSVTHLTDLYALGVMAFELLTGTLPFEHEEMMPLLLMHQTVEPPSPRSRNPSIPAELDAIVLRLLAKRPEDRFADCRALATALVEVRRKLEGR